MTQTWFADNIAAFARILRDAGLPIGPGMTMDALQALRCIGVVRRSEVFAALQAIFVKRHDHAAVFRQAFDLFFAPDGNALAAGAGAPGDPSAGDAISRRVRDAMQAHLPESGKDAHLREERISLAESDREILQKKDFAQMSAQEQLDAIRAMQALALHLTPVLSRRMQPDSKGRRLDLRATLRASLRSNGEMVQLRYRGRRERLPPLVVLLDISGSMSDYTRMFLHFLHAVADHRKRVSIFLFGTRLSNVTRALRARDPDEAVAACASAVEDWSGGTRIAPSLQSFNKLWGRRVLGQGAWVLLITDGLERASDDTLSFEMDRLHRSCARLIWLNPLLRFDGFAPKARGIQAMLPHVDDFLPVHNLDSLRALADRLGSPAGRVRLAA